MEKQREEEKIMKLTHLMNEDETLKKESRYFEKGERTIHRQIIPAKDRIEEYKRKSMQKQF